MGLLVSRSGLSPNLLDMSCIHGLFLFSITKHAGDKAMEKPYLKQQFRNAEPETFSMFAFISILRRTAAVTLYAKFGFQINKLIEKYNSSNRDAYTTYLEFTDVWTFAREGILSLCFI